MGHNRVIGLNTPSRYFLLTKIKIKIPRVGYIFFKLLATGASQTPRHYRLLLLLLAILQNLMVRPYCWTSHNSITEHRETKMAIFHILEGAMCVNRGEKSYCFCI